MAARDDDWARDNDPSKCRYLVDSKSIRYVFVEYGVYHKYWVDTMHYDELAVNRLAVDSLQFPVGAGNFGRINEDPEAGNAWHPTTTSTWSGSSGTPRAYAPRADKITEKLRRVTHSSFPGMMLMKIADLPSQLPGVERYSQHFHKFQQYFVLWFIDFVLFL